MGVIIEPSRYASLNVEIDNLLKFIRLPTGKSLYDLFDSGRKLANCKKALRKAILEENASGPSIIKILLDNDTVIKSGITEEQLTPFVIGEKGMIEKILIEKESLTKETHPASTPMPLGSSFRAVSGSLEMPHAMPASHPMLLSRGPATLHHSSLSSSAISPPPARFTIDGSEGQVVQKFKQAANASNYPKVVEAIQECLSLGRTGLGNMKVIALLITGNPVLLKEVNERMTIPESRTQLLQIANETPGCNALKEILKPKPTFTP